jgi:hypothetical protein
MMLMAPEWLCVGTSEVGRDSMMQTRDIVINASV